MSDVHEAKYREMQKYVPFIQRVIEKLKVNNDNQQADNPRKAQLHKMEMLHDLLTNKHKKIRIETLIKCEGVLIKLQAKIEKQSNILQNEDLILSDVKLKQQMCSSKNLLAEETEDILGPASPPPEVAPDDDIDQPVVIPTERRSSPVSEKGTANLSTDKYQERNKETPDQSIIQGLTHSVSQPFDSVRKKVFNLDCKAGSSKSVTAKHNSSKDRKSYQDSIRNAPPEQRQASEFQHAKHFNPDRQSSQLSKDKNVDANKTSSPSAHGQKLQTVKVVITEPLPTHVKMQHFPTSSKYLPISSVCHNNLRTLPQAVLKKVDNNEVYRPEELWDKYNESHDIKAPSLKPATAPVFSRLGAKVSENSSASRSTSKTSGRYTPIPDVLKSPPLSVSDINNLLIESGSDKILNDISDIGSRRETKNEDYKKSSPNNSFEFVRKKLAQTARMNSSRPETPIPLIEKETYSISSLPHERIALKYNPHPRQERSMSISSTEGSECSFQSKTNDPRLKSKLHTSSSLSQSPTQVTPSNVNVLPAINLSDPRLKKQNTIPMPSTFTSTPKVGFRNQSPPSYVSRKDPRISRIPNNTIHSIQITPVQRMNTNQLHYSSEENWDSDEQDRTLPSNKIDPRLANNDHLRIESRHERSDAQTSFDRSRSFNREMTPIGSDSINQSRLHLEPTADKLTLLDPKKKAACSKLCPQLNAISKEVHDKAQITNKQNIQKDTTFIIPNPPKSDTEEDWDSEPESSIKQKPFTNDLPPQLPTNNSPVLPATSSYRTQISPTAFMSPKYIPTIPAQPIHIPQIHNAPAQYPLMVGTHIHPNFRTQNTVVMNRFNSVLNDQSERIKYLESKKQKPIEPRTYKEFREAKERAQAQEAAIKRAADEAKAKKKCDELKESDKGKETIESTIDKKEKQIDALKKVEDDRKEKKLHAKDNKKPPTVESTLDKMYRTQNFNSNFPKANTSFKIPKKKSEEKPKEVLINTNEAAAVSEQTQNVSNNNKNKINPNHSEVSNDKIKPIHAEISTAKIKTTNHKVDEKKADQSKCGNNDIKTIPTETITCKQMETKICDKFIGKHDLPQSSTDSPSTVQEPIRDSDRIKENPYDPSTTGDDISSIKPIEKENKKELKQIKTEENNKDQLCNSDSDDNKVNVRDPRCRPKSIPETTEADIKEKKVDKDKFKMFGDIVITSSENQVVLKPQQNLDKFNRLAQEIIPQPQRILRRRNTMVVFDSVPLVDKEKLKKANALLFEDVQEEEKRKRKQAEEERLVARRNKNLEEMFKRTDDNCTVSTQNIISGKRRTRAAINFNETVNAKNVFNQKTVKDSSPATNLTTTSTTRSHKAIKTNFKIKVKNLAFHDAKCDESDDDETLDTFAKKQAKIKESSKIKNEITEQHKTKPFKEVVLKEENKTEESETETPTILNKKRGAANRKSSSNNSATSNDNKFKPTQNDEHQNCAVSSTSADIYTAEEATCSSTSTNISFKRETDDNEPTSTAHKSNNPTPTPEPNEPVLNEIVDQILTPNGNREHILGVLSQILSEDKLELIKSLIEKSNKQNEQISSEHKYKNSTEGENSTNKVGITKKQIDINIKEDDENEEDEQEDKKPLKSFKPGIGSGVGASGGGKKINMPKKKRSELDRLNEDIRDMFICNGVITATGRRMCTIMGKDVGASTSKKSTKELTPVPNFKQQENTNNTKDETLKPPIITRSLRRSVRGCKITDNNEDNESTLSRGIQDSLDDSTSNIDNSIVTDTTPQRKMPVLKPHTPIKIPEELKSSVQNTKELTNTKRKSDSIKPSVRAKKSKANKDDSKEQSDTEEEKECETEANKAEEEGEKNKNNISFRNTNVHWHNQSKYSTWCMICEKKITSNLGSVHYKTHHGENYISRMAPVILQKFKQGKLNKPLFGVKKANKQPSWFYRCPFCLKYFNTSMPLWLEHFQNHTVEFRYECSKCHRCCNRKATVVRHIKSCEGATIINSAVKLNIPTIINAHVCHLCNFIQLKRDNLERHYIEQHQLEKKTVDLSGYTIKLFDVQDVECVNEKNAAERENKAWKSIEKDEQVIDIDDDEISCTTITNSNNNTIGADNDPECAEKPMEEKNLKDNNNMDLQPTKKSTGKKDQTDIDESQRENILTPPSPEKEKKILPDVIKPSDPEDQARKTIKLPNEKSFRKEEEKPSDTEDQAKKTKKLPNENSCRKEEKSIQNPNSAAKVKRKRFKPTLIAADLVESQCSDFEMIDQEVVVQNIQDELLALAAKAAEREDEIEKSKANITKNNIENIQDELLALAAKVAEREDETEKSKANITKNNIENSQTCLSNHKETNENIAKNQEILSNSETPKAIVNNKPVAEKQTTMSDLISSSIDMIYNRTSASASNKDKSTVVEPSREAKPSCPTTSNIFMSTRDESSNSPTIQILAQSIINIEEHENNTTKDRPVTMAERLSQRLKDLHSESTTSEKSSTSPMASYSNKNSSENAFEKLINDTLLELTKEKDSATTNKPINITPPTAKPSGNVFQQLFRQTVLDLEKDNENETENENVVEPMPQNDIRPTDIITVISDDEDWEDIEITETAPTASATGNANVQKSKNKGLFQKFGVFKGNNTKSKKHLTPMVFLPKKKTKEKPSPQLTTLYHSPTTTTTAAITKANEFANTTSSNSLSNSNSLIGFKPVVNIMDGLFPDSPCNDPIDLVPELAPLEPLQDLNDISSILDSNLSAVNINAADNHTSIEDALDFISEQQANDNQKSTSLSFSILPSQAKTTINNISHVGFSVQSAEGNSLKFYCLLQNCSFLYSSDALGLENHFMCEHSQIKWNGYCLMCQSKCFPSDGDVCDEYSISKEINHMMEKHANKLALDLNADSTQHSTGSSHDNEERPKIKLRRLTGDCLSRATPEQNSSSTNDTVENIATINESAPLSLLGALLVAEPMPPTKEMPPQPQMPLTEPILLDNTAKVSPQIAFRNVNSDFLITSVTSAAPKPNDTPPLQISSVISLSNKAIPPSQTSATTTELENQIQIPKISNVRTLASTSVSLPTQQIEEEHVELDDSIEDCIEVSRIFKKTRRHSTSRERVPRSANNDSPVLVAETVPLAQSKTGGFVVTQTVSAQYSEFSSTALGFNISIAASTAGEKSNQDLATPPNTTTISSRQYKCMGTGCKFVSRVPVAMSDHLRFHERRNLSDKQDYLVCGFCFYCASDVEDYMKHASQFHIINKGAGAPHAPTSSEAQTATSLTKKIQNILNSNNCSISGRTTYSAKNPTAQVQDTEEVYLKKLRETIDEIVGPTGLGDDKLYRCVIRNCHSPLSESTFLNHIMFHITTTGANPNNYIFRCPHCTAQYHRAAGIKAHIKNHARNRYFCYLCDETSTNPGQLLKHFSEKHWHSLNMYTRELLPPKLSTDGSDTIIDSSYFVVYTQGLSAGEVRKFGEKLILEWQRKKCGSKTHFKSTEIDLLPLSAIFQRQVNCGECEYKTKVRTNMFRHLLMHKQNPGLMNKSGVSKVCSVDPINPVPCLNSSERFFDKMTNLASSSLVPSGSSASSTAKLSFKLPHAFVEENKRYTCGCRNCNYHTISEDLFRMHLSTIHSSAMVFCCPFCNEEICKRGLTIDRIMNHTRFHGTTIYRCEECNYVHHLRYVVDRHINEKHAAMKVNIATHNRSTDDRVEGTTTTISFEGKKYKEVPEINQTVQASIAASTRSANSESSLQKPSATYVNSSKLKGKWLCDMCGHRTSTVGQMQTHCQQQHSIKNQYKCAHCNFDSHQLSQILHHIDEKHAGKTREARYMYHKTVNNGEELADTRPLWQRNDPTRIRHIRGILMEDEEESEEYRKKLSLEEDADDDSNESHNNNVEENDEDHLTGRSYVSGYEFGCYHCSFKTHTFEDLKNQHYAQVHNSQLETAKPFWYRLHRRLCCPECRLFLGNYSELQQHLHNTHKKSRFYAADIRMAENDDTSQRILCGYCSFHCANAEHLYKHHLRAQHWPQDIRIDNNEQIMEILTLGKAEVSYQCTLCADIFSNRVAIVQHACNLHAGEDSFSFRELTNSLIYRCNSCCYTSTTEAELLRHTINHYSRFKFCSFCQKLQSSFNVYMQHCYGEHRNDILRFKTIYPLAEIRKFLLQILIIFPSGLVLNKRNLLNTKYGKTDVIDDVYEDMYKISQQPPIPRLSIATLVARKSIEAQQKHVDHSSTSLQDDILEAMQPRSKSISKRRRTVAFSLEDHQANNNSLLKPKINIIKGMLPATIIQRRTTVDNDKEHQLPQIQNEFNAPLKYNKIDKRRRTVAVDRETLFSSNLSSSSTNSLLTEIDVCGKKRKSSYAHANTPSPKHVKETIYPANLDMEPFSFYGQTPEAVDLTKIYTKISLGGITTPLTVDNFKSFVNIDCQLKLIKCDVFSELWNYNDYKHIKKACPASQKLKHN